jgi:alkylglycerol monooxygenase
MRKLSITSYEWVYENFRIYDLPYDGVLTYAVSFLFIDFAYYWFHRAAHEINLFWAAHQTHHSSEEYNLSSALRQSMFQGFTSWVKNLIKQLFIFWIRFLRAFYILKFFYLPLGLFVRPSIYIVHSHLNLIYQFWIHTEVSLFVLREKFEMKA